MNSILFKGIGLVDSEFCFREDMYVGVSAGKFDYISSAAPDKVYDRVIDGTNKLICPAFVNTHTHLPMTLLRGYAENLALSDWLNTRVFPFEAKIKGDDVYYATLAAQAEMLRFGCVSSTEMYFCLPMLFKATDESGVKMNGSNSVVCFGSTDFTNFSEYKEYMQLLSDNRVTESSRFKLDMAIHAEYTTNPTVVELASDMAKEYGLNMQLHLSETASEHAECKARHNLTPAAYFAKHGAFDVPCTAAHCVHLEGDDFAIMAEKGVTVAANPISNLKLSSGFADIKSMFDAGVRVGLGTDGVASNNNLNMFEELKLFATINKALSADPTFVTPAEALRVATRNGALSQGRDDCGLIKEGFKADLFMLDTDRSYMYPRHDMLSNIVYSAQGSDVVLTMCDGEVLYENGVYTTIDIEKVVYETNTRALAIANDLKG